MPNHCSNCLYVYGDREEKDVFIQKSIKDGDLDLHTFVPLQENENTYSGHIKFWGTKWNCYETKIETGDEFDKIYFQTAWCPYNKTVQKEMSKKFPNLCFMLLYVERGQEFQGYYISSSFAFESKQQNCDVISKCEDADECSANCEKHDGLENPAFDELYQTSG
jgi:hypothetical protein